LGGLRISIQYTEDKALFSGILSFLSQCLSSKELNTTVPLSLTHGVEPFLRSCQLCSYSRTSQHCIEPEGYYRVHKSPLLISILSQISSIHTIPSSLFKIHFNIVSPPTSWVFPVISFLLTFPQISYMHYSSSPFVPHALPMSSSFT
jgi:hypothetical protein